MQLVEFIPVSNCRGWLHRWASAIVVMAAIFGFSAIPKGTLIPDFDVWDFVIKKSAHAIIYAILANTYLRGLTGGRQVKRSDVILSLALAAIYAFSDETHQKFVPGREGSLRDVGIDVLGAVLGLFAWRAVRTLQRQFGAPKTR
ncbi:MAG: VanZ family protein [Anaerolineales bacterium]